MNGEKRKSNTPIPDKLEELLNEAQRQALPGLKFTGWEPCFLRNKNQFLEPDVVMRNTYDNRLGILEFDGSIRIDDDVKVRNEDDQILASQNNKAPIWKK